MSNRNIYAIVRIKTGKLITENTRLPIFWYKKEADRRAKDFIGVTVVRVSVEKISLLLNNTNNGAG